MSEVSPTSRHSQKKDYPYFRRVWINIVVALLAVSFIPLILIGGGMYYYSASVLKEKTLKSLRMEVDSYKKAIDQFLTERIMSLTLLSSKLSLMSLNKPDTLQTVLQSLHRELPWFQDLGVIDDQGRHLAYAGPYDLISKNYKNALWFKAVMKHDVYISDVFTGFRNVPHFIIAVKQVSNEGVRIIRATIDNAYFNNFVSGMARQRKGDVYLVNKNGIFQTSPRPGGQIMAQSELKGLERFQGIKMEKRGDHILMTVWQEKVPWLCVVRSDWDDIFAALHRVRNAGVYAFVLGACLIVLTVLLTTNHLVSRLEFKRRSIRFLDQQLRQTSQMASAMPQSYGLLREIKDTLANIDVTVTWIQDLTQKGNLNEMKESLEQIESEVLRSRRAIDKFLNFFRPDEPAPIITEVNVNDMLDDIVEFFSRGLWFNNIRVRRDYEFGISGIRSNLFQLRQVFQNLILNAMAAIQTDGEILLKTYMTEDRVMVVVTDDGPGIPEENMEKVFSPLFTTKSEGIGLGLSISVSILEKLGGNISVRNEPERGASFTVELPLRFKHSGE